MDEESYQPGPKKEQLSQIRTSKLMNSSQFCKNYTLRTHQDNVLPVQSHVKPQKHNFHDGGGDRLFQDANNTGGSYRRKNDTSLNIQMQIKTNKQLTSIPPDQSIEKYQQETSNSNDTYETDSNFGGEGVCSESGKSQKSSKSIVSKKSSQEMRKMVTSQCKLHEVIDKTLKQMCGSGGDNREFLLPLKDPPTSMSHRNYRCNDLLNLRSSKNEAFNDHIKRNIVKGENRFGDGLTISVDDVINSKVVTPMIRKLQRMYLNNLREEMSLMEDLERLPHKVNEVYKATIFKQK